MIDFSQKKFGIVSLGCDKNRVDSEKLLAIIKNNGCYVTSDIEEAQILIVNTCAFLNESRKEAIETVIDSAGYKNIEKIVVTGCLPQKYTDEVFENLTEADVLLGVNDYDKIFDALNAAYTDGRANFVGRGNGRFLSDRVLTTPSHYAYLKIADGCNNRCTYCLIPKIRGKYVSYPMEELISEAENLGNISELILVAQDVTRYGIDLYGQKKLVEILQKLTELVNINSVRLLYCYPEMIDDELIAEIKNNKKIIKYLDIPLRENIPDIALRSTFIAGFPSETEDECQALCDFLKEAKLDNCGFFAYSRERETAAYNLKGQLPAYVKNKRVKKLYSVQREISAQKLKRFVGKKISVLCDGIDYEKGCFVGRAYFNAPDIDGKVYFNAPFAAQGEYYEVLIYESDSYDLKGKTEDYDG